MFMIVDVVVDVVLVLWLGWAVVVVMTAEDNEHVEVVVVVRWSGAVDDGMVVATACEMREVDGGDGGGG